MKLLNINAWGGKQFKELIELLNSDDFDFITMQEVFALETESKVPVYENEKVINLYSILSRTLPFQFTFFSSTAGKITDKYRIEYGNVIFSKFPIRNSKTIFFDVEYDGNFKRSDPDDFTQDPRNAQIIDIQLPVGEVQIANTHGIWQLDKKKTDTQRTVAMTKEILESMDVSKPSVLAGDFNLIPETKSIRQIEDHMQNLVVEDGITNTRNKFKEVEEVVDYVFINNKIKVSRFEMIESDASDHNALILDFEIVTI